MIIQLYPNEEKFEFEHDDEHVMWVNGTQEQLDVLSSIDWLVCAVIDVDEDAAGIDFDIHTHGISGAFMIANLMLENIHEGSKV